MLPGISIWGTLLGSLGLSIIKPLWMIYAILVFDIYWVLRVIYFSVYLILSWWRFRKSIKIAWFSLLTKEFPNWQNKINAVFLPLYNEEWTVVQTTLGALLKSSYPASKLYLVVSGEARKGEHWQEISKKLTQEYASQFADIIYYTHPDNLPGEIAGKGSNINYAEHQFKNYADKMDWKYEDIIISVFDIDTVVHPEYFAQLNYMYCRHPHPERSSFQPVTLYNNNLWESPSILRVMAFGTSFWMLFSLARLDNLVTFSSHSMSYKAALDVGGHVKDLISEDSHIFFQCWLRYDGNYEVTPLYVPVSMDTVRDADWWTSLKNLYYQQRRWAWGSENIAYLLWEFKKHPEIPWHKKALVLFHEWEGKWSWGVVSLLILILGQVPLRVAGNELRQSALFFNTPQTLNILMTLAMLGLLVSAVMSMLILPQKPQKERPYKYAIMLLQWLLLPVSLIFFSAIPCIDAVTHLMFGRYLGFNVSSKKRV